MSSARKTTSDGGFAPPCASAAPAPRTNPAAANKQGRRGFRIRSFIDSSALAGGTANPSTARAGAGRSYHTAFIEAGGGGMRSAPADFSRQVVLALETAANH